jgi:hypothetical protein
MTNHNDGQGATSETSETEEARPPVPGVDFVVDLDRLLGIDIDTLLSPMKSVDCHDISRLFSDLASNAVPNDQPPLQLLAGLTDYHFVPDHRTEPFRPKFIFGDRRSLVPSDLLSDQIDVLAGIALEIDNAGLRARLADVAWFVQRKRHDMAEEAISAYCDCVRQVRDGASVFAFGDDSPWGVHAKEMLVRAARISHATRWQHGASERLRELIRSLVAEGANPRG